MQCDHKCSWNETVFMENARGKCRHDSSYSHPVICVPTHSPAMSFDLCRNNSKSVPFITPLRGVGCWTFAHWRIVWGVGLPPPLRKHKNLSGLLPLAVLLQGRLNQLNDSPIARDALTGFVGPFPNPRIQLVDEGFGNSQRDQRRWGGGRGPFVSHSRSS
ncbi:hypothetical protein BN874_2780003 [Candidatus Contendobacter odensis Run_B_J11]|uniref:Uncharacterized protein n=1 Tax=Candidatus Contendobacter odensis Run_B_J11 TaxID=1400861 RepID=A0A7U7GCK0_9GAMM|nr:hypothetical protein BN874_2780003 [Candidatus Contendobacter odensis Run_B_J11]